MGESTLEDKIRFQKNVYGPYGTEKTSINPQIMNLSFPSIVQHKNGFLAMKIRRKMQKNVKEMPQLAPAT